MAWLETLIRMETYSYSNLFFYVLVSLLVGSVIMLYFKRRQKVWLINQIPGPKALPLIGNALEVNVEPIELFKKLSQIFPDMNKDGAMIRVWIGFVPYVIIYKSDPVKTILSSQKHIDKSKDYDFLQPWLGTGLLTSTETAMGRSINAQDNSESDYVNALYRLGAIIQLRQSRPWLQPDILFKLSGYAKEHDKYLGILHGFSYETIRERRKELRELKKQKELTQSESQDIIGKKKRLAFLDTLLEYSEETNFLTDEDIREEVDTFMFEGHDTTAAAICWSVYLLGSHPEIQAKVYDEIYSIFGDSDRPATSTDLREMKYLECCVKEALRLFPSVPFIARELREDVQIDSFRIPSGTTALISTYTLHRDPEQFPDPELFLPERFYPENVSKRHPYSYVPFSAGPRNCIGQKFALMEEKVVLSSFLRKFRVESTVRREDLKLLGELILRPESGMMVKIYPRN